MSVHSCFVNCTLLENNNKNGEQKKFLQATTKNESTARLDWRKKYNKLNSKKQNKQKTIHRVCSFAWKNNWDRKKIGKQTESPQYTVTVHVCTHVCTRSYMCVYFTMLWIKMLIILYVLFVWIYTIDLYMAICTLHFFLKVVKSLRKRSVNFTLLSLCV